MVEPIPFEKKARHNGNLPPIFTVNQRTIFLKLASIFFVEGLLGTDPSKTDTRVGFQPKNGFLV